MWDLVQTDDTDDSSIGGQHGRRTADRTTVSVTSRPASSRALGDPFTQLLSFGAIRAEVQPIVRLTDGEIVGYEALARCDSVPGGPDAWFSAATEAGLGPALEEACLRAVAALGAPPNDRLLFVNLAPCHVTSRRVERALARLPRGVVIELTEQDAIADVTGLGRHLERWNRQGFRFALDDVGAGYAGLTQIVRLRPEFLKLDRHLIDDIHRDRTRQALVASLVGFAKQVGTSLVAEGVETDDQLRWLRDAGVALAQGWLFARPGPPWPRLATSGSVRSSLRTGLLASRLDSAASTLEACEAVADHLFALGGIMPSVYLEAGGRLRCLAQRGLWQVLDGMATTAGITGRAFRTGTPVLVQDVSAAPDYLEAIPGVVSEFCLPLRSADRVVGALNVEALEPLDERTIDEVTRAGTMLGARLSQLPEMPGTGPLRQLATLAAQLVSVSDPEGTARAVVAAGCELTGLDSGTIVTHDERHRVAILGAEGPLGDALAALCSTGMDQLMGLLGPLTSCYSSGESTGLTFIGGQALRDAGACALVVLPLVARGRRSGLLLLAGRTPAPLGAEVIEPVELLATLAGSCLEVATHLDDLESRVRLDALTGLGNHARFHEALRDLAPQVDVGLVMFDIDGFKQVNDTHGHLVGDELLRVMAGAMTSSLRAGTHLFRVGGDELAAIVPGPHHRDTEAVAVRLRQAASGPLRQFSAGISAGAAIRLPGEPVIETLARADAALYRAKRSGRGVELS